MVQITIKDILNLLDAAKKKRLVKFATNDKFYRKSMIKYDFGKYCQLYYAFYFVNQDEVILDEKHADTNWLYGRSYLNTLTLYYMCYCEVFGTEPFNLAHQFYDSIEIGEEYGWIGDSSFNICIDKQIINEHTITVNLIHGYIVRAEDDNHINKLPILYEQITLNFNFSITNKNLLTNVNLFNNYFQYPHRGYTSKKEKDEKDFNGKTLAEAAKETIKRTKSLLKLLEKDKKISNQ